MFKDDDQFTVTRHVCPRNCYNSCSMLGYTKNGVLTKVTGDPAHGYTNGKLCAKGYSYVQRVYNPQRLRHPQYQSKRGSGQWQPISWEAALKMIANKILDLKDRYGSNQALALNKYSGNFGLLHFAADDFFRSLGATQAIGSPCWSAGLDACYFDFGGHKTSDPSQIVKAKLILLWGVNPAWTAIHSMPLIYDAQAQGAKVVVLDPVYTTTAKKADYYLQLKPGSDGALALALAKIIVSNDWHDQDFLRQYTLGWEGFVEYLAHFDFDQALLSCGQSRSAVEELAQLIATGKPVFTWIGFGLQRHVNGGQSIRAINGLAALTGNIGLAGGGVHFAQQDTWCFNYNLTDKNEYSCPANPGRSVDINRFPQELATLTDPPVKMLWIACRNLATQDPHWEQLLAMLNQFELIVAVDQFMTPTAKYADLLLPTTTHFEELDVVPSYWHHWLGINEPAIKPYYESKSDLEIFQLLSQHLNLVEPGSCSFPATGTAAQFIDKQFNHQLYKLLDINHWHELSAGPKRLAIPSVAWADKKFLTPSGKFEFYSSRANDLGFPPMATYTPGISGDMDYPYWLLTTHSQYGLNSQFQNLAWMLEYNPQPLLYINPNLAAEKGLADGDLAQVYNNLGAISITVKHCQDMAPDILLCHQGWFPNSKINLNKLVPGVATDMGAEVTGSNGVAFYHAFVNLKPAH